MTDVPQTATPVDVPPTAEYVLPEDADWEDERWDGDPAAAVTPRRPRRKLLTPASLVLAGVVVAGVGFIGGVQVQKSAGADDGPGGGIAAMRGAGGGRAGAAGGAPPGGQGATAAAGTARGAAAGDSAAAGGAGAAAGTSGSGSAAAGAAASASGTTVGAVVNVKGSTLYVAGADGTTIEVRVGARATVQRLAKTTAKQVRPGDSVVVTGTTRSDGGVTATAVQAMASGLTLDLGGFRAGAPGAAGASGADRSASSGSAAGKAGSDDSGGSDVDQLFGEG